jgi:hypothetical protein
VTPGAAAATRLDDALERLAVFVIATGLAGLALALFGGFRAPVAVGAGLLAPAHYHRRAPLAARAPPPAGALRAWHLVPALLVALVLRVPTFDAVLGWQDQGVYTHVAAQILRTGGIAVHDPAYARLSGTPARDAYAAENFVVPFMPGVYTLPGEPPGFVFQFYHLFPVWLATVAGLLGWSAAGYALVFLSLVSVLFFQRLAHALTGRRDVAVAAGLLLAVNPLHAFFSRFLVTEVPTLAFGAMGFAWLARYAQAAPGLRRERWLALSCGAFACLFLTRISGFMYMPLLFATACLARLLDADRARGAAVSRWAFATIALYLGSVLYGLAWTQPYALKLYSITFVLVGGSHWPAVLAVAAVLAALLAWWMGRVPPDGATARRVVAVVARAEALLGPVLLLVLALGAWKLYRLGFTSAYAADPWFEAFPGIAGQGWAGAAHGSLVAVAEYACPLLLAAYVVLAQFRWPQGGARMLRLFLLCFLGYAALLNWRLPYQPFYARYFASELVPGLLLFVACACAWVQAPKARAALWAVVVASGLYGLAWSAPPVGLRDGAGAAEGIAALAGFVGDDDVLLIDAAPSQGVQPNELKPALAYVHGRNVVTAGDAILGDAGVLEAIDGAYRTVYLASTATQAPPGFERAGQVALRTVAFPHTTSPPVRLAPALAVDLVVYRLREAIAPGRPLAVDARRAAGLRHPVGRRDTDGVHADGRPGELLSGPALRLPAGAYVVRLRGNAVTPDAWLEVASLGPRGARVLAAGPVRGADPDGVAGALRFDVAAAAEPVLVRVRVPGAARVRISGYVVTRLR